MRRIAALSLLALSGCPWDAQGNYIGERLPDGGIPASAYQDIDLLQQWTKYAAAYGGKRSRPKPTPEQLCSFWPSGAVVPEPNSDRTEFKPVGVGGATTREWVFAVLGLPPGGIGIEGEMTVIDRYSWDAVIVDGVKQEQGGITLEYEFVTLAVECSRGDSAAFADGTPVLGQDCSNWKLKTIQTYDPQPYLTCWRNAETWRPDGYMRVTPRDLYLQSQGLVPAAPDAGM